MKILFIEPRFYFERLISIEDLIIKGHEVRFGVPVVITSLKSFCEQYDLVVTCIEHSAVSRRLISYCNYLGLNTVLIMDGTYEFSNSHSNPYLKKIKFKLLHSNKFTYVFSIDLMMKGYIESLGSKFVGYCPRHANPIKKMKNLTNDKILLTTANSAYFDEFEFCSLIRLLTKIIDYLEKSNIDYSFRIYDKRVINELNIEQNKNDINEGFQETLLKYSHVVSTPSTIINTAVEANIPTALLLYRDAPITQPAGWIISDGVELNRTFISFLSKSSDRMNFQKRFSLDSNIDACKTIDDLVCGNENESISEHINKDYLNLSIEYKVRLLNTFNWFKSVISKVKKK
ncbi:hypothetical protein [Vibrio hippocampi]|uniref:Uncharacterized protein n=1 Tax=Vibrio hippocampi TaxID=654686 RepID=A0ABN8DMS8_9VIBR|nr:hypothetical protein [Vibrio hippocampi]CAH0527273.1 hypothetical protein VHP8226_02601 [Vibrio hippocampi]